MSRRQITSEERVEAIRRGREEGARQFPGRNVSVQVEEKTDEHGNVVYKIAPVAERQ